MSTLSIAALLSTISAMPVGSNSAAEMADQLNSDTKHSKFEALLMVGILGSLLLLGIIASCYIERARNEQDARDEEIAAARKSDAALEAARLVAATTTRGTAPRLELPAPSRVSSRGRRNPPLTPAQIMLMHPQRRTRQVRALRPETPRLPTYASVVTLTSPPPIYTPHHDHHHHHHHQHHHHTDAC